MVNPTSQRQSRPRDQPSDHPMTARSVPGPALARVRLSDDTNTRPRPAVGQFDPSQNVYPQITRRRVPVRRLEDACKTLGSRGERDGAVSGGVASSRKSPSDTQVQPDIECPGRLEACGRACTLFGSPCRYRATRLRNWSLHGESSLDPFGSVVFVDDAEFGEEAGELGEVGDDPCRGDGGSCARRRRRSGCRASRRRDR